MLSCSSTIMKAVAALVFFVTATQAIPVSNWVELKPLDIYVTPNPRHTAEEWDVIYAAAEANIPENRTGLVLGITPQPEDAGKVFVKPTDRITTGTAASRGQFPWQVLLIVGESSFSGGSLISTQWVLTAAHCLDGFSSFQAVLGSTSRVTAQSGTITQNARQVVIHPNYSLVAIANDIGVLRLTSPVTLTNYINVVRLPLSDSNNFAESAAIVSGFGRINSANSDIPSNLLYANVEIITNAECARTFGSIVQSTNICSVGSNGKGPCTGDSGGPLVVDESDGKYTLVGVVSFGYCLANQASAYARVSKYLAWISSTTGVAI